MTGPVRLRAWLELIRAPNLFTAFSNILAAHLIATGGRIQWGVLALLGVASLLLYAGGMVLNDCFDMREDTRERPARPLPSGRIAPATAWSTGWILLLSGVLVATLVSSGAGWTAMLLAGLIVVYDSIGGRHWWGVLVMGLCRYLNWLLGLTTAGIGLTTLLLPLPVLIYVGALTLLSRVETSARSRGPVWWCAAGMLSTFAVLVGFNRSGLLPTTWALGLFAVGLGLVLFRLYRVLRDFSSHSVQQAVMTLVLGIIPLDAMLVLAAGPWWGALAVVVLLLPGRLLARRLYVT